MSKCPRLSAFIRMNQRQVNMKLWQKKMFGLLPPSLMIFVANITGCCQQTTLLLPFISTGGVKLRPEKGVVFIKAKALPPLLIPSLRDFFTRQHPAILVSQLTFPGVKILSQLRPVNQVRE